MPWPFGRRTRLSRELREEIRFYLEMRADELEREGMDPADAWRAAVEAFGDPDRVERRVLREASLRSTLGRAREFAATGAQGLRLAARGLARDPGFTLVAVATLALGIGVGTAIVSVADQALLTRPPVERPDELVAVYTTSRRGFPRSATSYLDYLEYRDRTAGLADLAATNVTTAALGDDALGSRLVRVQSVTDNYFGLLGVHPLRGRVLVAGDDRTVGGSPPVVLSHALWSDHFGADDAVVDATVRLNGRAFQVVGVAAEGYRGLRIARGVDAWIPLGTRPYLEGADTPEELDRFERSGNRDLDLLVGRLTRGTTVEVVRAELTAVSDRMGREDPERRGSRSVTVDPLDGYILPAGSEADFRGFLLLLGGTVVLALLLCSANLANLLLARASARRRDMGVRLAIGAGRGRLVGYALLESLLLAGAGGLAGLAVAVTTLRVLGGFELPGGVAIASLGVTLDANALMWATVLALGTGLLFGLAPALDAGRTRVASTLQGARGAGAHGSARVRTALVAVQVGLCVVLLVGSGLFVRTLRAGFATDLGFDETELAMTRYDLSLAGYEPARGAEFIDALEARLAALPGVQAVATTSRVPLLGGGARGTFFSVPEYQPAPDEELRLDLVLVTPGYTETLRLTVLQGRPLAASDAADGAIVALVNRGMAERYWPAGGAVGRTLELGATPIHVVGVVENNTWDGLADEVTNFLYIPVARAAGMALSGPVTTVVRATGDPGALLAAARSTIRALDAEVAVSHQSTMEAMVADVLMPQRMGALLLSAFGALALLLSGIGIVGVVSYAVTRQRRDIGVRVALGARRADVLGAVAGGMAVPVLVGLVGGTVTALNASSALESFLFGVRASDPATYAVIALGVAAVAALATWLPARAATRVDPVEVLKAE